MKSFEELKKNQQQLLANIKWQLPKLKSTLEDINRHREYEEYIYRLYHQSFKVYYTQADTIKITGVLADLMPGVPFNEFFRQIFVNGTTKKFELSHNDNWLQHTGPIIEAFFHARHILEMAIKYGDELQDLPNPIPFGWGTVLYLFDLR